MFPKTGNPNRAKWPPHDPKTDLVMELGREVKFCPPPHAEKYAGFERTLNARLDPTLPLEFP